MSKLMRMMVFFDLPTKTKQQRLNASRFRNFLLADGYYMVQLSVYARICGGTDSVSVHRRRLQNALPPQGAVRLLVITERQYENIDILLGTLPPQEEKAADMEQLMLF